MQHDGSADALPAAACFCTRLVCARTPQLLAQVSYLKAISSSYQPVHALQPPTTRLLCHGARHKSTLDILEGWAAAALRPVATLLQPLQTVHWSDSHPSGRDLEAALVAATAATSAANSARQQQLQGLPPPKHANPAIWTPAAAAAAPAGAVPGSRGPVGLHALNRFCWDTATRPHAAEAVELAARAALPPGTDMTPEDVAARKAAAAQAAEAAVAHALLLSTLPVWFAPGETGSCSAVLQAAAELLPMPAYGLSLDVESPELQAVDSLQALAAQCVQQLLSVQQAGPYVLVGCGVFSCMLAAAMSSVLEHQMQQQQQAVLVLLDGPPAPPSAYDLADPVLQGLYAVLRDAGRLPAVAAAAGGCSYVPISFAGLAAELSARVQAELAAAGEAVVPAAAVAGAMLLAHVAGDRVDALEAAVLQVASGLLDASAVEDAAVHRMLAACRLVRRLCGAYAPEFVYNAPAVLLLTEDAPGQAFLEVARESCGGELSLVPLAGLLHGQVLTGAAEQQTVVVALVEGLMEMLQQV